MHTHFAIPSDALSIGLKLLYIYTQRRWNIVRVTCCVHTVETTATLGMELRAMCKEMVLQWKYSER